MAEKTRKADKVGYLFILPWVIGFLVFTAFPIAYSFYLSFFKVKIDTKGIVTDFNGIGNYIEAFTGDVDFVMKCVQFSKEIAMAVPMIVILSLIIAILLNQNIKGRGFFRTIYFLPVIIASGPVLDKLNTLGMTKIEGIENFSLFKFASSHPEFVVTSFLTYLLNNIVTLLWFSGVQILIFLAALQKVDKNTFEAARIDGASRWEIFWKITLPSLAPMILVNVLYTTVIYSISSLNPIIVHIKDNMFKLQTGFGYAAALSWIYFILILIIIGLFVLVIRFFRKDKD